MAYSLQKFHNNKGVTPTKHNDSGPHQKAKESPPRTKNLAASQGYVTMTGDHGTTQIDDWITSRHWNCRIPRWYPKTVRHSSSNLIPIHSKVIYELSDIWKFQSSKEQYLWNTKIILNTAWKNKIPVIKILQKYFSQISWEFCNVAFSKLQFSNSSHRNLQQSRWFKNFAMNVTGGRNLHLVTNRKINCNRSTI